MLELLLRILGADPGRIAGAEVGFVCAHAPRSWMVFVVVALVLGLLAWAVVAYRRDAAGCRPGRRLLLTALRVVALLLLFAILLGPSLALHSLQRVRPVIPVLVDASSSMGVRDRYLDPDRAAAATALAAGSTQGPPSRAELMAAVCDERFWTALAAKGEPLVMRFAEDLRPLALDRDPAGGMRLPAVVPSGTGTDLTGAILAGLRAGAGRPIAGVVLVGDGRHTCAAPTVQAAEALVSAGVGLYAIGLGEETEPANWRVAEAWASEAVFRADPFQIQARIAVTSPTGGSAAVELVEGVAGSPDAGRVVGRTEIQVGPGASQVPVSFTHRATASGEFLYTIRVPADPAEQVVEDNQRTVAVRVLDRQLRVLLVAGAPTWDFRLLRTLFIRDRTIDVSCWLQSLDPEMRQDGDTVIERLPASAEALFAYDCLILLDPNPAGFDEAWTGLLQRFLAEHGGGLCFMAGPKYTHRLLGQPATARLAELLPVEVDATSLGQARNLRTTYAKGWPLALTPDGVDHPLLAVAANPALTRRAWESLATVHWSFPVRGVRPAVRVLAEHSDLSLANSTGQRPLLVQGQYGPGRTLFVGFEGTWRWRPAGEDLFDWLWVQAVRHLTEGRVAGGASRGRLATDRDRYDLGERIHINGRFFDRLYQPLRDPELVGRLVGRSGRVVPVALRAIPEQAGYYAGDAAAFELGLTRLEVDLDPAAGTRLSKHLSVEMPQREYADTRLDRVLLTELCQASHGTYRDFPVANQIPAALPDRHETVVVPRPPLPLWDTPVVLALVVFMFALEWWLRLRSQLL